MAGIERLIVMTQNENHGIPLEFLSAYAGDVSLARALGLFGQSDVLACPTKTF